jgi:F0F1-type ATP synthase assembly protein I
MASQEPSPNKKSKTYNSYLKYSSLGFQLLAAIGFFGWLGYLLDQFLKIKFPAFMLLFGFAAFGGMMYQVYRSIKRDNS